MTHQHLKDQADIARVVSKTRRYADLLLPDGSHQKTQLRTQAEDVVVGDLVRFESNGENLEILELIDRENKLERSFGRRVKSIAANVDRLFVVTAVGPLFNTAFIDRVSVVAELEHIPCTLVLNKIDLGLDEDTTPIGVYSNIGMEILHISAKEGEGIPELKNRLEDPELSVVTLLGVSGVGKSTILNALVPDAARATGEVSERTGQGKQTTSQALGYPYKRESGDELIVIDLPGIQNFGISKLDAAHVTQGFIEFAPLTLKCEYHNCLHISEPNCAVKDAVQNNLISQTRYDSYLGMIQEIESFKEY